MVVNLVVNLVVNQFESTSLSIKFWFQMCQPAPPLHLVIFGLMTAFYGVNRHEGRAGLRTPGL